MIKDIVRKALHIKDDNEIQYFINRYRMWLKEMRSRCLSIEDFLIIKKNYYRYVELLDWDESIEFSDLLKYEVENTDTVELIEEWNKDE